MMIRQNQPGATTRVRRQRDAHPRWLLIAACAAVLCLAAAQPCLAQVTTPTGWESWPPSRYNADWPHQGPAVTRIYDGAHFNWLAATFAVQYTGDRLELWRDFGAGAVRVLVTPVEYNAPLYLLVHPWRGPHLVYYAGRRTLAAIYPVDYYVFQASVLSENSVADDWLGLEVARNGPVVVFNEGNAVRAATYYGLGYQVLTPDTVLEPGDTLDLAVDREGDFVMAYQHGRKLYVQQFREGQGWVREILRKYDSPADWQLVENKGEVRLKYMTRRGWDEWASVTGTVIRQWWF